MSNASDKPEEQDVSKSQEPGEHAAASAKRRWAKEKKSYNEKNPVEETFYELALGHKVLLCKKKKSGSVYRQYIGSTRDKEHGAKLKVDVEKLKAKKQIRVR